QSHQIQLGKERREERSFLCNLRGEWFGYAVAKLGAAGFPEIKCLAHQAIRQRSARDGGDRGNAGVGLRVDQVHKRAKSKERRTMSAARQADGYALSALVRRIIIECHASTVNSMQIGSGSEPAVLFSVPGKLTFPTKVWSLHLALRVASSSSARITRPLVLSNSRSNSFFSGISHFLSLARLRSTGIIPIRSGLVIISNPCVFSVAL